MHGQKPTVCLMQDIPCDSFLDGLCRTRAPLSPNSETNRIHPRAAASRELYLRITRISVSALIETHHLILLHR